MSKTAKQLAKKSLEAATSQINKTDWYFNLHFYRFISILKIILDKKDAAKKEIALELGVWPGYLSLALQEAGFNVHGIDLDSKRLPQIKSKIEITDYDLNNIPLRIPYPDNQFDWIVASEIIEHLNPSNLPGLFVEIKRLLKNNGFAIITTPNKNSLANLIPREKNTPRDGHGHMREYAKRELQRIAEKSSLKIIKLDTIDFYSNIGSLSQNNYFYPLKNFWKYPRILFNWLKFCSIPLKKLPPIRDSLMLIVQKND